MSRGGRRRKSRRRGPVPGRSQASTGEAERAEGRSGAPQSSADVAGSAVEQMRTKTKPLQAYPPDDLVLDDLITGLQDEYGIPSTPQEYRLVIKTPSAEADPAADPAAQAGEESSGSPPPLPDTPAAASGRRRRRRRVSTSSPPAEDSEEQDLNQD
ncbi:MAG: hypothetical protein WD602_04915 [Actinomycetota bacterium]